ncbi:MAG: trigger factor [Faecalibacterium sp.]|jgi:trigger factor|nr:trigger factor [Faecalibacterium sp.]
MKLEKLEYPESKVVKMTFSATAEELEAGAQAVYERTRDSYTIKGFEKGQADRAAIEAERGEHVFWYDAINDIMDRDVTALMDATVKENSLVSIGEPVYDLVSVKKDEGFTATATLALKPELTLEQYTGFEVECRPAAVSDKEIDRSLERRRAAHAELVSHKGPAVKGNTVLIDYKGFMDGKPFEHGEAKDHKLVLGKGMMIPGFEDGILGHSAGDEFDLPVKFPATYRDKAVAGKDATFHIVLHDVCVSQLPALNSDFAKAVGKVDTMEQFRADIRKQMEDTNQNTAMGHARSQVLTKLGEATKGDLPSILVDQEYNRQLQEFQMQMQMMRMPLSVFLQQTKQTKDEFLGRVRKQAELHLRMNAALEIVAEKENLYPTEEELNAEVEARATRAKKTVEEYTDAFSKDKVRSVMGIKKAREFVLAHSTIKQCEPEAPKKA